jgi:hypothetical protein
VLRVGLNSPARRLSTLTNRSGLSPIRLPLPRARSICKFRQINTLWAAGISLAELARRAQSKPLLCCVLDWALPNENLEVRSDRERSWLDRSAPWVRNLRRRSPRIRTQLLGKSAISGPRRQRMPSPLAAANGRANAPRMSTRWMGRRRRASVAGCSATPGMMFWGRRVG